MGSSALRPWEKQEFLQCPERPLETLPWIQGDPHGNTSRVTPRGKQEFLQRPERPLEALEILTGNTSRMHLPGDPEMKQCPPQPLEQVKDAPFPAAARGEKGENPKKLHTQSSGNSGCASTVPVNPLPSREQSWESPPGYPRLSQLSSPIPALQRKPLSLSSAQTRLIGVIKNWLRVAGVGWRNKWCGGHSWCCGAGAGAGAGELRAPQIAAGAPGWVRAGGCVCFAWLLTRVQRAGEAGEAAGRQRADAFCLGLILISIPAREKV